MLRLEAAGDRKTRDNGAVRESTRCRANVVDDAMTPRPEPCALFRLGLLTEGRRGRSYADPRLVGSTEERKIGAPRCGLTLVQMGCASCVRASVGCSPSCSLLLALGLLLAASSQVFAQSANYLQYNCNPSVRECSRRMFNIRGASSSFSSVCSRGCGPCTPACSAGWRV